MTTPEEALLILNRWLSSSARIAINGRSTSLGFVGLFRVAGIDGNKVAFESIEGGVRVAFELLPSAVIRYIEPREFSEVADSTPLTESQLESSTLAVVSPSSGEKFFAMEIVE